VELGLPTGAGVGADGLLDAVLGTGFEGEMRPNAIAAIAAINAHPAPTVSVDVPSGVDASSGEVPGEVVKADLTITFHRRKLAHAISPAGPHAGRVHVADIGLHATGGTSGEVAAPVARSAAARVGAEILRELPLRRRGDNKYTAGHVLVVGGSTGLTGAPALSALAALRTGAGVAVMCVPASLNGIFEAQRLEVMTQPCADVAGALTGAARATVVDAARRAGAVVIGPGLGPADATVELVLELLAELAVPVVLDADGLRALNGRLETLRSRAAPTVLTPHAGELGRLLERPSAVVDAKRLASVREAAELSGAVALLKGADTMIAESTRERDETLVVDLGTPGLATAGTGDVLTGAIAAALAKGVPPTRAAAIGATLCGTASCIAGGRVGMSGLIASDVVEELPAAVMAAHGVRTSK
ncbi:MAG: NAD(P)H-hydrate dehydratase, partial [Gaiellaceae bacterium]